MLLTFFYCKQLYSYSVLFQPAISTIVAREAHNVGHFMSVRLSICLFDFCRLF